MHSGAYDSVVSCALLFLVPHALLSVCCLCVQNSATGELIAVKQVRLNTAEEQEQAAAIQNEIGLMENLRHPNIVSLLGTQRNGNKLNILMEYVPGKCWGRGTELMRADGSLIAVEDIKVGMQLMGDDCTPRTVQPRSVVHGTGEMFEIQLESREAWRCNAEHILVLRMADSQAEIEMSVAEYLKLEPEVQKQTRMFAVNPAEQGACVDAVPAAVSAKACSSSPFTLTPVGLGEYFGFALDGNRRCLLADGTVTHNSLDSLLEKFGGFSEKVIRSYTKQLLEALMYCHGNRVVHRDIKGKNILIDTKGNLKVRTNTQQRKRGQIVWRERIQSHFVFSCLFVPFFSARRLRFCQAFHERDEQGRAQSELQLHAAVDGSRSARRGLQQQSR